MGLTARVCALGLCLAALASVAATQSTSITETVAKLPSCAIPCFATLIQGSGCNGTDSACLCAGDVLQSSAPAACVAASCIVRDVLTTKRVANEFCNVPVQTNHTLAPVFAVFLGLSSLAVLLRILARILTKVYFWWDDIFNFLAWGACIALTTLELLSVEIGMGRDIWLVEPDNITRIMIYFFVNMLIYTASRFLIRASIILFYIRVFPCGPDKRLGCLMRLGCILKFTFCLNFAYNLSFFLAVLFQCTPVHHFWDHWEGLGNGHCGNVNILVWVAAVTGIFFDIWLLALPFPQLLALNLHWKKKVMDGMMFSVGAIVMIISLVRLRTINGFTQTSNPTRDIAEVNLWSSIEMHVGVICPCLPSFRMLLRKMLPRLFGTTTGTYEMGQRTTTTGTRDRMGRDSLTPRGITKQQTIEAHGEPTSTTRSEKASQDDLSNPCDAWSVTELMGTKTEIRGASRG